MMKLSVLVDFDNLLKLDRERGLDHCVNRIVQTIGASALPPNSRVHLRLYGGWYVNQTLSRRAQELIASVEAGFPKPILVGASDAPYNARVTVELARSLLVAPSQDVFHTYRVRAAPDNIECKSPPYTNCVNPTHCKLFNLHIFLQSKSCPADHCTLSPAKILRRPEQKLVDTMIVADLIQITLHNTTVVLVSSDDDMYPGIHMGLSRGARILHIHTRAHRVTPDFYLPRHLNNYIQQGMS